MDRWLQFAAALFSAAVLVAVAVLIRRVANRTPLATEAALDPAARQTPAPSADSMLQVADQTAPVDAELPETLIDPALRVEKGARTLTLLSDDEPIKSYPIALGNEPIGDKEREGDGRTPEGIFYVCVKNPASRFHRSLGLSYPSEQDADRGLAAGLISKRDHRAIVSAIRHMQRPPWKTALGGEIAIHGGGSRRGDWTQGCIALEDDAAEELFNALPLGTPVEIRP